MAPLAEPVADRVKLFIELLKPVFPVRAAYLFGSWAEGRANERSDIDIGIVMKGSIHQKDRLQLFSLGKDYDVDFDVVVLSERDFETEDPVIVHEIKTKGIRIA